MTHDPIVRAAWIALVAGAVWLNVAGYQPRAQAQTADPGMIILQATPTPALPAFTLIAPTPKPWIDQALDTATRVGEDFADDQADQLAAEQQAAADQAQYLANVGAQAPHSPRGDVPAPPPSYSSGPVAVPLPSGAVLISNPDRPLVALPAAVAVPAISADQAAVLAQRTSNGCPDGETFYPRTGCHATGSGGAMPGAVGEATP